MAKKQSGTDDLFNRTEPSVEADLSDLDAGNIKSTGVGLREGEIKALDAIGQALGEMLDSKAVARNALIRLAARRFIEQLRRGDLSMDELAGYFSTPEKPQPRLKL
jgi:hypothetical protein